MFKTTIKNLFKIPLLENWIVKKTQNKQYGNFYVRLLPPNKAYPKNSWRNAERQGIKYHLDISDYMEYTLYFGIQTEPREKLYNLINDKMTIIDIGTNIGETLLNFAKINQNGINYGFEPVPYLYQRATKNIELNNFKNIILNNVALSDEKGSLFFQIPNNNNSGGISMNKENNGKEVKAITLDDFVNENQISQIDFIKIDVEGFEMNVLKGAKKVLEKFKPTMFIELDDQNLKKQKSSAKEVVTFLIQKNYTIQHAENKQIINENFNFTNTHFDIICE
jgi:FkbM family methyltransferase